jgi:hypothetical protein
MHSITVKIALFLVMLFSANGIFAQGVNFFATEPEEFYREFTANLNQAKGDRGSEAATMLSAVWSDSTMTLEDKEAFITMANIMVSKRFRTENELAYFTQAYALIRQGTSYVRLDLDQFMDVTLQCVTKLEPKRTGRFFRSLVEYIPTGYPIKRNKFSWYISQNIPDLKMIELPSKDGPAYEAPVLHYENTDLVYKNIGRDSTRIKNTRGDFNLIAITFVGNRGRVDWSKVGLDSSDVYCDFRDYKLNFHYGLIKVDTVDFHYNSLLKEPIVGMFEDLNLGYKNINKANYPYFKSHAGGVVIENFIPNVRYEGGFSLKGIRKIGSAYDIWVDYVPPPSPPGEEEDPWSVTSADEAWEDESRDEEWGESEWDYSAVEESEWDTDDSDWDDTWEEEDSYEEETYEEETAVEEEVFYEEEDPYFNKVKQHVLAKLEMVRGDTLIMKLEGEAFVLDLDRLVGKSMAAAIYTSTEDSIFHPSMDLLYTTTDSTITLKKPKRGNFKSIPFTSSYHEYFLYFEAIIWDLQEDKIEFTAFVDKENKVSAIESFDYFTKARFTQFKNVMQFNPIGAIYRYAVMHPDVPIFPASITDDFRLPDQLEPLELSLPGLEGSGFITYDKKTKQIFPLPKLYDWARAARNKKDYDAIQVISKVDNGAHATMRLEDKNIEMRGVYPFSLSDSVYLRVLPLEQKVTVMQNRNLEFGGALAVGKVNFYSNDEERPAFTFDYESYKIACDSIDSMRFVLVRNPPPGYEPTPLEKALSNTVFEGITGAIHVDDPNNKNGQDRKKYRHFPVFDSYGNSYLYWAKPNIEGGVYTKDKMYFALAPFVLDSLEDFNSLDLSFQGEFFSSEIFPSFKQELQVMEDGTLGFVAEAPPTGHKIYDGNGKFYSDIKLDGSGLQGNGTVEYLGTVAKSDSFVFHFDSVMAEVHEFNMRRGYRGGVYFPEVTANTAQYKWFTKDSVLQVSSTYEALSVFGGEGQFTGTLSITHKGMVGTGDLVMGEIKVSGDSIVFHDMDFEVQKGDFIVLDESDPDKELFVASDVEISYDVRRHQSNFETKEVAILKGDFPIHQYKTTLAKGFYKRINRELKLETTSSYLKDNIFVSTDPKQDSLNFKAQNAVFNIDSREVDITGVPNIFVADAMITPQDQNVVLQESGLIRPLENATIEADQESKLHRIYEATVSIYSRSEYEGGGKYDYIEVNGKEQYIDFANIKVNSDTTTIASGIIQESQGFYLTERIFFRGNTQLDASEKFLTFEGEVRIESENPVFKGAWFKFNKTVVNPDSVFIPIDEDMEDPFGNQLTVGLNYVPENRVFYSNFLQAKDNDYDMEVLSASGGLTFDRKKKEFRIGSEEKLKNQSFRGATVSFNDADNTITSQGFMRFPYDFEPKTLDVKMAGSWKENLRQRQISTNLIMGINMDILPKDQLEKLSQDMLFLTTSNKDIDFNQQAFIESVSELLDEGSREDRETFKFIDNVKNAMVYTDIKLSRQLPFTLLLSNVNFNYSIDYKALYSDSEVGLIGINGVPVNKMVNAKIVYKFGSIGADGEKEKDKMTIYLEVDEFNWVYFHFEGETLRTLSTNYDGYNYPLQDQVDKRKSESGFRFEMATEDEISQFRQDFIIKFIK